MKNEYLVARCFGMTGDAVEACHVKVMDKVGGSKAISEFFYMPKENGTELLYKLAANKIQPYPIKFEKNEKWYARKLLRAIISSFYIPHPLRPKPVSMFDRFYKKVLHDKPVYVKYNPNRPFEMVGNVNIKQDFYDDYKASKDFRQKAAKQTT